MPPDVHLDELSFQIHHIDLHTLQLEGSDLKDVLLKLHSHLHHYSPMAIVGHDVVNDLVLLVNEAIRVNLSLKTLFPLHRLLCTKLATIAVCAIPLPRHLRHDFPCDRILKRFGQLKKDELVMSNKKQSFKWPNLEESYKIVVNSKTRHKKNKFNEPLHDARGDVARCRDIFLQLKLDSK